MQLSFYKIWINIVPSARGVIRTIWIRFFRNNNFLGSGSRIKSHVEWKLFPKCTFKGGKNMIIGRDVTISVASNACLSIGDNVGIGNRCQIVCHKRIEIGEGTVLAPNVMIFDHNHVFDKETGAHQRDFSDGEVVIGNHCWLGAGCILLKDVHIGDNSVVGAGSVVTKDIPSGCIAVGSPAKVIKQIE